MEISSLTVKLIIILIPGLVAYFIYKRLTSRPNKRSDFMFISISIFLGVLSYLFLQLLDVLCCWVGNLSENKHKYESLQVFKSLSETDIPYKEVIFASIFGIVIAYLLAWMDTKNLINRIGIQLKVTEKESDETLYLNYLSKKEIDVVYIRDAKNNLTYVGKVFSFSERENTKEIVLEDVIVYFYDSNEEAFKSSSLYLTLGEGMTVEQADRIEI